VLGSIASEIIPSTLLRRGERPPVLHSGMAVPATSKPLLSFRKYKIPFFFISRVNPAAPPDECTLYGLELAVYQVESDDSSHADQ
jgi:hypothetical protein